MTEAMLSRRSTLGRLVVALVVSVLTAWGGTGVARAVDTDMAISTAAIDFGDVNVGNSATLAVTLTNTGGDPFGPISMFGGTPPTAEFTASQNCQGTTLPAGGSCTVSYTFSPSGPGAFTDTSAFTVSETVNQVDGEDFSVSLTGTGVNPITVAPTALDFGAVTVGSTDQLAVTVTNTSSDPFGPISLFGGSPLTAEFSASQNCQSATLAGGASCTITYGFTPSGTGTFTDRSSFTVSATADSAAGEDFTISLTGCGETGSVPCAAAATPTVTPTATPTPSAAAASATPLASILPDTAAPRPTSSGASVSIAVLLIVSLVAGGMRLIVRR